MPDRPAKKVPGKPEVRDTDAADAAVAEVERENQPETEDEKSDLVELDFNGHHYSFKYKRLNSMQYRSLMQKGSDLIGLEWLIGTPQFNTFVSSNADEDGVTSIDVAIEFIGCVSKAVGAGNF